MADIVMMEEITKPPDYTLLVEGKRIEVHKERLAEYSQYFNAMFRLDMKESAENEVEIREISAQILQTLVDYAYTEKMELTVDEALGILKGACMLQFDGAVDTCNNYLMERLDHNNCLSIMHLADANGLKHLYNKSKVHSLWYFSQVIHEEDFLQLPLDILIEYIDTSTINIASEFEVFKAIKLWIAYAPDDREKHFPVLFDFLRLNSLSHSEMRRVLNQEIVEKFSECRMPLEEMLAPVIYGDESPESEEFQRKRLKSEKKVRMSRQVPKAIWSVGGDLSTPVERWSNQAVSEFNSETLTFEEVVKLPMFTDGVAWGYKSCVLGKDLFVVGGEIKQGNRPTWSLDIWKYDIIENRWSVVGRMDHPRRHHSVVAHSGYIYVAGGFGKHRIKLDTASRFHIETGEWEKLPNLPDAIFSAPMCMSNNHLYIVKSMIYYLAPGASHWTMVQQPLPREIGAQCALPYSDKIYLLGSHVNLLLEFDTVTNVFAEVGSFQKAMGQGCVFNDKIYVFCGEDSGNVECYDIAKNEFSVLTLLEHCMFNHGVVVVPNYPPFL